MMTTQQAYAIARDLTHHSEAHCQLALAQLENSFPATCADERRRESTVRQLRDWISHITEP